MASSARTYLLYEGFNGEPKNHWQYWGDPTVPGCYRDWEGNLFPPDPRWTARATSAKEACAFAHKSITSLSREDGLGIWFDAAYHHREA